MKRSRASCTGGRAVARRMAVTALAVTVPSAAVAQVAAGPPTELAITHTTVVDVDQGTVLRDRTVLIRDGRIALVGPAGEVDVPGGMVEVDAEGAYLIPGLWDAHVHSAASTAWHFPLFIAHGVTSVRNLHSTVDTSLAVTNAVKRQLASGALIGPRFIANGGVVDGRPAVWPGSVEVTTDAEARAAVDSLVEGGADFIKVYDRLTPEVYAAVLDQARHRGIPVDGHIPMAVPPEVGAAAGQRTFEHGSGMTMGCSAKADSIRGVYIETLRSNDPGRGGAEAFFQLVRAAIDSRDPARCRATVEVFRTHDVAVTPTLVAAWGGAEALVNDTAAMRLLPERIREQWIAMSREPPDPITRIMSSGPNPGPANVRMLHDAGVPILAGTDVGNPFLVPGRSLHHELELLVEEAGLTPAEALRTATVDPARVFGMGDSLGTVVEGAVADLVLLRLNPLEDIGNVSTVLGVVLGGRYFDRHALDALLADGAAGS